MRKGLAIMGLLSVLGWGAGAAQDGNTGQDGQVVTLKVSGMSCGACAKTVEQAARKVEGVKAATASQPKGTARITYDPAKTTPEAIAKAISDKTAFTAEAPSGQE
jgi:copper chaperone CopZ